MREEKIVLWVKNHRLESTAITYFIYGWITAWFILSLEIVKPYTGFLVNIGTWILFLPALIGVIYLQALIQNYLDKQGEPENE